MFKKLTALLLCAGLLFLSGCTAPSSQEDTPQTVLTLMADTTASPAMLQGADSFCSFLEELSGGSMTVQVIYSSSPLSSSQEEGVLYLLSYQSARQQIPALVTLELPYLWDSPRTASDFFSSLQLTDYLNQRLEPAGLVSLGGVPCGSRYFVARKGNLLSQREMIGLASPYYSINGLPLLPLDVRVEDWELSIQDYTLSGYEIPLWLLPEKELPSLKINPSPHAYDIGWIWADSRLLESFSPKEQAWLIEAALRTFGSVEKNFLTSDQEMLSDQILNGLFQSEVNLYPSLEQLPQHNVTYRTSLDIDLLNMADSFHFE